MHARVDGQRIDVVRKTSEKMRAESNVPSFVELKPAPKIVSSLI